MLPWMLSTAETEDLVHVALTDFDDHYLAQLAAHHHATIDRSRTEMLDGLSSHVRGFAERAIAANTAGLHHIEELSQA
jgi:uncharacterized protein (DUF305 family)